MGKTEAAAPPGRPVSLVWVVLLLELRLLLPLLPLPAEKEEPLP